ncbi:hypothetical protein D5400_16925 [Georhizobium profundi]|uniref:Uncharacterized protein n=1 Tax=Georhizobium profundi TaxID=2341112 RepID=A0A3Q8XQ54_9HYPH|nr:hypothetical protein [Georhizobium profundi]AZN72733.1 hypothetical protein D5400_16925 [Georhizobium profundi]
MSEPEQGAAAPAAHQIFIDPVAAYYKGRMDAAENTALRQADQLRTAHELLRQQQAQIADLQAQIGKKPNDPAPTAATRKPKPKTPAGAAEKLN